MLQQHGFILPTLVTGFAISTLHFQVEDCGKKIEGLVATRGAFSTT